MIFFQDFVVGTHVSSYCMGLSTEFSLCEMEERKFIFKAVNFCRFIHWIEFKTVLIRKSTKAWKNYKTRSFWKFVSIIIDLPNLSLMIFP